jgi:hypothetical protein
MLFPFFLFHPFSFPLAGAKEACPPFVWRIKCSQFGDAVIRHM